MTDLKALHEAATPDLNDESSLSIWGARSWDAYAEGRLVEVGRCRECAKFVHGYCRKLPSNGFVTYPDDYCSRFEPKEATDDTR